MLRCTFLPRRAGNVFRALAAGALLAAAGAAGAQARADCDAESASRVLSPGAGDAAARAYWRGADLLQWPGKPGDGRYRLVGARDAGLRLVRGGAAAGVEASIALTVDAAPPASSSDDPYAFVAPGVRLRLDPAAVARVRRDVAWDWVLVQDDARGRVVEATRLQWPGFLDAAFDGAHADLGPHVDAESTRLGVWAPTARAVAVCLYDTPRGASTQQIEMRRDDATGAWHAQRDGDLRGTYYAFLVDVVVPGVGIVRNRVTDPYAVALAAESTRALVADLDDPALAPPGWASHPRPAATAASVDMTVYELHVRDFSIADRSVPDAHRGRYLAFMDAASAGMRHLRALHEAGLTDVHLLPVFDVASVPERSCVTPAVARGAPDSPAPQAAIAAVAARDCYNWGYDPYHFGAPEGSYASDADGTARVREFRAMVQALHAAGLRVGMDVVYNHTHAAGQDPTSVLDRIVPGYYQRLDATGAVERSTCCANTATEHRMMARLMSDTLVRWARDYGIDSFRFDLMGHQPRAAMEAAQRALRAAVGHDVPLIGEGWNFGEVANGARFTQAAQGRLDGTGIATFSDRARDALRGGGCCDGGIDLLAQQGWLNGLVFTPNTRADPARPRGDLLHAADLVRAGLAGTVRDYRMAQADGRVAPLSQLDYKGQPAGYAAQPGEVVNYVENHDNLTLFDLDALRLPAGTSRADRARVQALGIATVALSQGVAYYHAGIDVLRSKSLDRNSFDSGDAFNRLDWTYTDNGFGIGLPRKADNGNDWPLLAPVLRDASIKPTPHDIAWTRDVFRDWLRIRASTPLLRLRDAGEIQRRLAFRNTGPTQDATVVVGHLDGTGLPDARFREVLYVLNASPGTRTVALPEESGKRYVLHPVQRTGADARVREARFDPSGRVTVPGRTAAVFVLE